MLGDKGEPWLKSCLRQISDSRQDGLAEDFSEHAEQEWEPLPLKFDEDRLNEAEVAVAEVVAEVRENNGYAATEPVERDTVLATLETGQTALGARKFTRATIVATLERTLAYLAKKFTDSAIGLAAKKALEAVLGLL